MKKRTPKKGGNRPVQKQGAGNTQSRHTQKGTARSSITPKARLDLFGVHAVEAAWLNPKRTINALYITDAAWKNFEPVYHKGRKSGNKRPDPVMVDKGFFAQNLPHDPVHQGIGLTVEPLDDVFVQDLMIKEKSKDKSVLLILDQVTDPHNVGAIMRSACAFGAGGLIMQRKHAPELKGVLAKTACGAVDFMDVACETNLARTVEELQEAGYIVLGLDEHTETEIAKAPDHSKIALVLGAEGPGIRRLIKEKCDMLVKLPTQAPLQSLNVSNAAAISLYAVCA